jgi:outer membrane protein assembly factor BamB
VKRTLPPLALLTVATLMATPARGEDWPMWRHDAQRTGAARQQLAAKLYLQWTRDYPKQKTAWLDQPQMIYDRNYEPVVLGQTLFVGSARHDTMTALDTRTGAQKWTFYTDGPIRFAPVAWDEKVYFVSDDGYLYCVAAETGKLVWKFRGGPDDRRLLGNSRLISAWPARGAPVIADGTIYFAASIWPFMGIFIHALDARTGRVIWTNDGDGSLYMKQPHNADSFAGVAPQGELTVIGDKLLVPGGRSVPACYDRKTGKMLYYRLADNSRLGGGPEVAALGRYVFNGGAIFELETGNHLGPFCKLLALGDDVVVGYHNGKIRALDLAASKLDATATVDRRGQKSLKFKWAPAEVSFDGPKVVDTLVRAGFRTYLGTPGQISAIELPLVKGRPPITSWKASIDGNPVSLIAADDRLFAVTLEGRIYCFGPEPVEQPKNYKLTPVAYAPGSPEDGWSKTAKSILDTTKAREGYCVAWGVGSGRLIAELARQSKLHIIVVEPDAEKVLAARRQLIDACLYGERVVVHTGLPLPPYLASLMVSEDLAKAGVEPNAAFVRQAFAALRPYGGVAWLPAAGQTCERLKALADDSEFPNLKVKPQGNAVLLVREGALPGAGNWTHEHADAANTRVSPDEIVKAPLGLLWFGGSSNQGVLPRHGHGPQPQVVDGRLFIEGVDMLRAVDIYTGRVLWESAFPGLGKLYNVLPHSPGANATGTNFISASEAIYVVHDKACVRLDPATGARLGEFRLPKPPGAKATPSWGYINVAGDFLIAGADPLVVDPKIEAMPLQLQLWDSDKRQKLFTLEGHGDSVWSATFSPDGKTLATGSADKTVRLWDVTTGKPKATLQGYQKKVTCVAFSPDGKTLATGCEDATILIWDLAKPQKPAATIKGHADSVLYVGYTPDGKALVTGSADASVKIWDPETLRVEAAFADLADDVTAVAVAPNCKVLAIGQADGTIKLWDMETGELRARMERHREDIYCLAFSADSSLLASGSRDKTARLWDTAEGKHLGLLQGHQSPVTCVAFTPDGKTVASATAQAMIYLWDVAEHELLGTMAGQPGQARTLTFAPNGKALAMGGLEVFTKTQNESLSASKQLVVMDRKTGKPLWTATAEFGFRHNGICIGGGRLYAIDRLAGGELLRMKRRGLMPKAPPRLVVFDLKSGKELWSCATDVFGTWLSYSEKHDVLVEAGRTARDTLMDEPKGMRAYKASDGSVLWYNKTYAGPAMLHGDTILRGEQAACELLTGRPKMRLDPITGQPIEWTWTREYGCNTPVASQCLLTFRSGAAGYYDLLNDGGTGNFGGFRSSCTNNLIVAGGLLNVPDYTRNCTCSYQNQCSLALVPMADVEIWTRFPVKGTKLAGQPGLLVRLFASEPDKTPLPIQHIGVMLGAPGCRRAADGRLWVNEYDFLRVKFADSFGYYHMHPSRIPANGSSLSWLASSGCRGISQLELLTKGGSTARYTVRLTFADPDNDQAGRRVFDVRIQDKTVLESFDIVKESGGRFKPLVKEFKGIDIKDRLELRFVPPESMEPTAATVPLLCAIEVVREE